jgi:peptidoglycan/xylan/chitin deacetylase (PgdA/CDA1 family)
MLNFRSASVLTVILAVLVFLLMIFHPQYRWLLLPVTGGYLVMIIIGSVKISSGFYLQALCTGKSDGKVISLTFDDGPDGNITPLILDILGKYHIPATFFQIGNKAEKHVDLIRMIYSRGHLLGIHSYSHTFLYDFSGRRKMEQDLLKAEEIIFNATGKRPLLFRPPYGVTNPVMAKVVKMLGYKVIGWSVKSLDTTIKDADRIAERVLRKLKPGAVILMHDTRDETPIALEMIIMRAKEEGYRFAGLEEVLGVEAYETKTN